MIKITKNMALNKNEFVTDGNMEYITNGDFIIKRDLCKMSFCACYRPNVNFNKIIKNFLKFNFNENIIKLNLDNFEQNTWAKKGWQHYFTTIKTSNGHFKYFINEKYFRMLKQFVKMGGIIEIGYILPNEREYWKDKNANKKPEIQRMILKLNDEIVGTLCPVFAQNYFVFDDEEEKTNIVKYPIIVYQEQKQAVKGEEKEKTLTMTEHKNAVTGHIYSGNNAELLNNIMNKKGYKKSDWCGRWQARKLKKQIKQNADGVIIKVFYTDDSGRSFCKLETIYNIEELEPMQKIESTNNYIEMIKRLKAV